MGRNTWIGVFTAVAVALFYTFVVGRGPIPNGRSRTVAQAVPGGGVNSSSTGLQGIDPSCISGYGGLNDLVITSRNQSAFSGLEGDYDLRTAVRSHGGELMRSIEAQVLYPSPGCRDAIARAHQRLKNQMLEIARGTYGYRLDSASRRTYCGVATPAQASCHYPLPYRSLRIARIHPDDRDHPYFSAMIRDSLDHGRLGLLVNPDAAYWVSRDSEARGLPLNILRLSWAGNHFEAGDLGGFNKLEFMLFGPTFGIRGNATSASDAWGAVPASAQSGSGNYLLQMGRELSVQWRAALGSQGAPQAWAAFYRDRASRLDAAVRGFGAAQFESSISDLLFQASEGIAFSRSDDAVIDWAALWWSAREVGIKLGCVSETQASSVPALRHLVESQYEYQDCRRYYALDTIVGFNPVEGDPSSRLSDLSDPRWLRFSVFASRKERATSVPVVLRQQLEGVRARRFPSRTSMRALSQEIFLLKEEMEQRQVFTWLGARPWSESDAETLLAEKAQIRHFLTNLRSLLVPWRQEAFQAYLAVRELWLQHREFLALEEWGSLGGDASISGSEVAEGLERLRIPNLLGSLTQIDPYIEFVEYLGALTFRDSAHEAEVCQSLILWSARHSGVQNGFYQAQRQIDLRRLSGAPRCLLDFADLLNAGVRDELDSVAAAVSNRRLPEYGEAAIALFIDLAPMDLITRLMPDLAQNLKRQTLRGFAVVLGALQARMVSAPISVSLSAMNILERDLIPAQRRDLDRVLWHPEAGYLSRCFTQRWSTLERIMSREYGNLSSIDLFSRGCVDPFRPRELQRWWDSLMSTLQQVSPHLRDRYTVRSDEFWLRAPIPDAYSVIGRWILLGQLSREWVNRWDSDSWAGTIAVRQLMGLQRQIQHTRQRVLGALTLESNYVERVRSRIVGVHSAINQHVGCRNAALGDLQEALGFQYSTVLGVLGQAQLVPAEQVGGGGTLLMWIRSLPSVGRRAPIPNDRSISPLVRSCTR